MNNFLDHHSFLPNKGVKKSFQDIHGITGTECPVQRTAGWLMSFLVVSLILTTCQADFWFLLCLWGIFSLLLMRCNCETELKVHWLVCFSTMEIVKCLPYFPHHQHWLPLANKTLVRQANFSPAVLVHCLLQRQIFGCHLRVLKESINIHNIGERLELSFINSTEATTSTPDDKIPLEKYITSFWLDENKVLWCRVWVSVEMKICFLTCQNCQSLHYLYKIKNSSCLVKTA